MVWGMGVPGRGQQKGPELGISLASDKDAIRAEMLPAWVFPVHTPSWLSVVTQGRRRKGTGGRREALLEWGW